MKSMFYVSICLLLAMAMLLGGCGSPAVSEITARNTDKIAADPAALTEEANTAVTELAEMFPAGIYAIGVVGMATSSLSRVTSALAAAGSARQMQAHRHSARRAVRRFFMLLRM